MNTENKSNTPKTIRDLWQTPKWFFNYFNAIYNFDTDVAASDKNHLCDKYITKKEDGLSRYWGKSNWCNPPYSNIREWVDKAIEQQKKHNYTVMLLPSDTSVKWFKNAFENASDICFIIGRLSFINATTGKPVNGNNKGSVVFRFGEHSNRNVHLLSRDKIKNPSSVEFTIETPIL